MGQAAGFVQVEGFATPTGLFISRMLPMEGVHEGRRIRQSYNNLATIAEVNALSRAFSAKRISVDEVGETAATARAGRAGKPAAPADWRRRGHGLYHHVWGNMV